MHQKNLLYFWKRSKVANWWKWCGVRIVNGTHPITAASGLDAKCSTQLEPSRKMHRGTMIFVPTEKGGRVHEY